ncbi:hypothetical protein BCR44DRAFT_93760 [Catenaria anguillulae PL171]|uniref:Peptidase C19 ubiquitin carboxyl-terminal hydrolase domain-containing protein n=1 Tax=Catenaria anguillulae PL171 TaxID=765915 RepID=A0A1Y2HYR3_9FUNG|nr:hypothetical protein BCR44DRAFT_93760 [Catenaria anguillulae PL171]
MPVLAPELAVPPAVEHANIRPETISTNWNLYLRNNGFKVTRNTLAHLSRHLRAMDQVSTEAIDPSNFIASAGIRNVELQEDAHELLGPLLDYRRDDENGLPNLARAADDMFAFDMVSFMQKGNEEPTISASEPMTHLTMSHPPPLLVIQLARFKATLVGTETRTHKLNKPIDVPITLNSDRLGSRVLLTPANTFAAEEAVALAQNLDLATLLEASLEQALMDPGMSFVHDINIGIAQAQPNMAAQPAPLHAQPVTQAIPLALDLLERHPNPASLATVAGRDPSFNRDTHRTQLPPEAKGKFPASRHLKTFIKSHASIIVATVGFQHTTVVHEQTTSETPGRTLAVCDADTPRKRVVLGSASTPAEAIVVAAFHELCIIIELMLQGHPTTHQQLHPLCVPATATALPPVAAAGSASATSSVLLTNTPNPAARVSSSSLVPRSTHSTRSAASDPRPRLHAVATLRKVENLRIRKARTLESVAKADAHIAALHAMLKREQDEYLVTAQKARDMVASVRATASAAAASADADVLAGGSGSEAGA